MTSPSKPVSSSKFVRIVLASGNAYSTNGGTAIYEVDIGDAGGAFADAEGVRCYVQGEAFTANFKFRVTTSFSVTGLQHSTAAALFEYRTYEAPWTSAYVTGTDRDRFGLRQRVFIEVSNVTGSGMESGRLYIVLEIMRAT